MPSLPPLLAPSEAEVIVFNKGGRDFRLDRMAAGQETPRESFYGFLDLHEAGIRAAMVSSSGAVPGLAGSAADLVERAFVSLTRIGARPLSARLRMPPYCHARVLMSYTDGFSLSLGLGFPRRPGRPVLMGGFHGLCDIEHRAPPAARALVRQLIGRALRGLDHAFFFGAADRDTAMERYGLKAGASSVIPFGVDTGFWHPLPDQPAQDVVVAIGQDPSRDYDLLAAAPGNHPTRIVTRRPVAIPPGATNVTTSVGDFFGSDSMTDEDLRRLYAMAAAVIVPVKDVVQPSGYSVSLQAMSCGRPVIISAIRGLWYHDVLADGVNCLLVPPGDARALGEAIGRVRADRAFADRLGRAAREAAVAHMGLDRIGRGTVDLARLGLALAADRGRGAGAVSGAGGTP